MIYVVYIVTEGVINTMAGRYKKGVWSGRNQKILTLVLKGYTYEQICKEVGLKDPSSICEIVNKDEFQRRKKDLQDSGHEKAREMFTQHATQAVEKILGIMQRGKAEERLQFDAAKEVLYQIGLKPVEVIETRGRDYTPQEVQSALIVMKETEEIADRLSSKASKFLVKKETAVPLVCPPSRPSEPLENSDLLTSPSDEELRGEPITTESPSIDRP